ncbi:hypothetical protein RirG_212310 [Rhizophagus irregularis DAOM 197198w]|uniref:Uncharacterized protein n=1 Tax=Rhizophagus irregularis (strain DAOM 197198w) TaxID=1432141 RepID=A0A015LQ68_RHIIW|nr:hypothetical protein RirG_212310 [Rhizophagus irregularis DAOM 197198w]
MVRLTFLFPKDKKFHEELKEKVFNDFGSEAEEAVKMIKSLIISDLLCTNANFLQKEDFRPLPADANLAVWYANKGHPLTEGEGYKKPRRVRQ